jgi:hypothetical protein
MMLRRSKVNISLVFHINFGEINQAALESTVPENKIQHPFPAENPPRHAIEPF